MSESHREFVELLAGSGLLSADEVFEFLDGLPLHEVPTDVRGLAQILVRHGKLTRFQARAICQGKARGLVMGNYVVLDELGRGGMGRVYKARHRRMDRIVALKILPRGRRAPPEAIQRFQQEVRASARVSHPNVVVSYDADEANGLPYLVMEFVDGTDLHSLVKHRGPLSIEATIKLILQAAKGLEAAHAVGVVHQDVKPANLMLDRRGVVKVLDMGLAQAARMVSGAESPVSEALIQDGKIIGTADYASPERADDLKSADQRVDVYGLGCTLFYLLAGRSPYAGKTLRERIIAHRTQPIPSLTALRKDVPRQLDAIFRKMVAKKPNDRYPSMRAAIVDLYDCLAAVRRNAATAAVQTTAQVAAGAEDPDRLAAQRVLDAGGCIEIIRAGKPQEVGPLDDLPDESFEVILVDLDGNEAVRPETLASLSGLAHLHEVDFTGSTVADDTLAHLGSPPRLRVLRLDRTRLTDAAFAALRPLRWLRELSLDHTSITGRGFVELVELRRLKYLRLRRTAVSDAALDTLRQFASLRHIDLRETSVSAAAVRALRAALPACEVLVDPDLLARVEDSAERFLEAVPIDDALSGE